MLLGMCALFKRRQFHTYCMSAQEVQFISCYYLKKITLQMFYEEGNALQASVGRQGCTHALEKTLKEQLRQLIDNFFDSQIIISVLF